MRHVRLLPKKHVVQIRKYVTDPCHHHLEEWRRADVPVAPPREVRDFGHVHCRCCGYPIKPGERAIEVRYYFNEWGSTRCYLHLDKCKWGLAHDQEPPDMSPRPQMPTAAVVGAMRARARRRPVDSKPEV